MTDGKLMYDGKALDAQQQVARRIKKQVSVRFFHLEEVDLLNRARVIDGRRMEEFIRHYALKAARKIVNAEE